MIDALEADILQGAITALRRRAARQRKIAADWTVTGENGVVVKAGEAAIALRIAAALDELAAEFERAPASPIP
jgi:hypothetical protein